MLASLPRLRASKRSLRMHVFLLIATCMVPLLGFSAFGIFHFAQAGRRTSEEQIQGATRGLLTAVDLHLRYVQGVLGALSTSAPTSAEQLAGFYEQSRTIAATHGAFLILTDATGVPIFNTQRPLGTQLPRLTSAPEAIQAIETGKPQVSNVVWGSVADKPVFVIYVPIDALGARHALGMSVPAETVGAVLRFGSLPSDWIVVVVDRGGTIVARSKAPEKYVGKPASASLREKLSQAQDEGRHTGVTVEGTEVYNFFSRSNSSRWTVAVAVPTVVANAPLWSSVAMFVIGAAVFLSMGIAGAGVLGRRISRALAAISAVTTALGKREALPRVRSRIQEANEIVQSLERASESLLTSERQLHEREASFRLLFARNPLPMWVYDQSSLRFLAVNEAACAKYGYSEEQFLGMTILDIRPAEDRGAVAEAARNGSGARPDRLWRHWRADGSELQVEVYSSPLTYAGRAAMLVAAIDVTERKVAEENLRQATDKLATESEERRRLFETSIDLIFVTDRQGNLTQVSPSAEAVLGYRPEELVGRNAIEIILPDDLEATRREMRQARAGRRTRNFETRYVHRDGHVVPLAWSGAWSEPEQRHFFIGRDMTERLAAEERLRHLAHFDQLTGLPNRITLQAHLDRLLLEDEPIALAMLDLDGFKEVNDTLGHSTGDELLKLVGARLEGAAGRAKVYRLGGDEFVAVAGKCGDPRELVDVAAPMLASVAEPYTINGHRVFLSASAGLALAPKDGATAEELLANADLAHYEAKSVGGSAYRFFQPTLRAAAQARRALDVELRRAFSEAEFELHYQPQVRLSDNAVVGAEALLRWRHPERGLLAPGAFIDVLEKSAIARDVGRWVLATACSEAASWQVRGMPPVRIGVNLFGAQFHDSGFVDEIDALLACSGLPPSALELEITENVALKHDDAMIGPLRTLREKGVQVAFDDFGTGYGSLSLLKRYPLSRIKIDRSFVKDIGNGADDGAIVRSLIVMAQNLGLHVIAEGIETQEQADFLRGHKCEEGQGYLFARPLSAADFRAFMSACQRHPVALSASRYFVGAH